MPHIMQNAATFTNMKVNGQQKMQNLVNSCTRLISGTPRYRLLSCVRIGFNILTYHNMRLYRPLRELHKICYSRHSPYLKGLLPIRTPHSRRLAESGVLNVPLHRKDTYAK